MEWSSVTPWSPPTIETTVDKITELHVPNDTRWNSMWDAIVVSIKLRPAVEDLYTR
jgi:hypothetical protein